ncbi:hypothetical protein [Roseobacter weihaiensis]|uniref:hypothetical protein n=1 Tax=Roseobacter weihaiensis TaxID=2763262 RepID=UPI001D09F934|nr:hypothetical protein [Roseobacter sp. H9]
MRDPDLSSFEDKYRAEIAPKLVEYRNRVRLSQQSVADHLGIDIKTYLSYEKAKRSFPAHLTRPFYELTGGDLRPELPRDPSPEFIHLRQFSTIRAFLVLRQRIGQSFDAYYKTSRSLIGQRSRKPVDVALSATAIWVFFRPFLTPELPLSVVDLGFADWLYLSCVATMLILLSIKGVQIGTFALLRLRIWAVQAEQFR